MTFVYRICTMEELAELRRSGNTTGGALDRRDGYLHLSTREQVARTLEVHFAGVDGLSLLTIVVASLPAGVLRFEAASCGTCFPHLYAPLPWSAVERVDALPLSPGGRHILPPALPVP